MGNINNSNKRFLEDWVQVEKQGSPGTFTNIWIQKKGHRKIQMIEYPLHVSSEEDIEQQRRLFWLRLNHPQLVSSMYFQDESQSEFCSSNYKGNIFIERIPLTLQTVTDIPFPDALHIYRQSLMGFHILSHDIVKFCFPISEEHIGINCESVCKVWMNSSYEKNFPSRNEKIHQHAMVRMIFQTIEENVDFNTIDGIPSPTNYVYQTSRSPSEVRFDEAITLFENYLKEFFGGQCPTKLSCVDRVGGVYNLSQNWKSRLDSNLNKAQNKDLQLTIKPTLQQQHPTSTGQFTINNGYTTFRRQEPVVQNVSGQDSNREAIMASTPKFNRGLESSYFSGSKVSQQQPLGVQQIPTQSIVVPPQPMMVQQFQPIPQVSHRSSLVQFQPQSSQAKFTPQSSQVQFPQGRVIQQIVYQNPSAVPPQIVKPFSQKNIAGSIVRMPIVETGVVNKGPISQRPQIKESFIQTKVINRQIENVPQPVVPQKEQQVVQPQDPLQQFAQQIAPQAIQQLLPQKVIPQGPVVQQVPLQGQNVVPPQSFIQRFPQGQLGSVRRVINFGPQKMIVPSQQPQPEVAVAQQIQIPEPQVISPPVQQITLPQQSEYLIQKTTSVYATPQNITKVEVQRIQSNNAVIQTQREQMYRIEGENNLNVRLRNDQQSISSINPQTNQVPSNEQISDKFSMMKQQPMDTSTRNFYTNMMDGDNNTQKPQQTSDYFSSYYANYTSKLYDANGEQTVYEVQNPLGNKKEEAANNYKYNVTIDDGMSSADFLSSLKNIKTTTSPFLKSETNYDYGLTTYEGKGTTGKFAYDSNKEELYKFDYKNYITTASDGVNGQNDLNIVGEKLNIVPAQKLVSGEEKPQYNINYEHQEGQNEAGNLKYESQRMQVSANDGSYAEQYSQTANYKSIFDKYATYQNYQSQIPISLQKSNFKLGENLKTQFSRNNTQEQQYAQMTKNTVNNTSYSPMHQHLEHEEYQVDYDPQILADLQKLKGAN